MKLFFLLVWLAALAITAFAADSTLDALLEKARILRQSGHPAEARPLAEQAVSLAQKQQAWGQLMHARTELSFEDSLSGNYDRALQLRLANLDTVRTHPEASRDGEEAALGAVAAAYSLKRDYASAVRYCRQDLAASEAYDHAHGSPSALVPHALQRLGINLYLAGQFDEARDVLKRAYDKYVAFAALTNETQSASYYETQVEVLRWLERAQVAEKRIEEALETAELGRSRALAATLASRAAGSTGVPPASPPPTVAQARAIAREHNATVVEYSLLYDYNPDLLFIFGNFEDVPVVSIYIWVIQPDGKITFHESVPPRAGPPLVQMVRQARSSIGARGRNVTGVQTEPGASTARPLQSLYNLLVAPIVADLPRNPDQLVTFVPQDWLFMIPFAALQDGSGHYLIEGHPLSIAPSLAVLNLTHQEFSSPRKGKGALIVGNPTMPSFAAEPGGTPRPLPPLPGAEREARTVAATLHATPLVGSLATKNQVLRRLPNAQLVHLATHGLVDQATGGYQSAVALAPEGGDSGFLTMREIQNLKLSADLVVLSACDTALGKMSGDGILGLSRSFITAGIPSVMVSLWAISDDSTAYLMEHFYEQLQAGQDKAKALRLAMLSTMGKYPDPLNWAAFLLIGETAVSSASSSVAGDAKGDTSAQVMASAFVPPIPAKVSDFHEDPDPTFGGTTSSIDYTTPLTLSDLVRFYKHELETRGLKEVVPLEQIEPRGFSMVYRGSWGDRELVIQANDLQHARSLSLRFERRRDADAEFSPAENENEAGLTVPSHATGLDVSTKIDFSTGKGDITFLTTMAPSQLRDMYRTVFQRMDFSERPDSSEKADEKTTYEFRNKPNTRALFLHIEASMMHPERREVRIHFEKRSK